MNDTDDLRYPESCRRAVRRDITINTIQCGNMPATTPVWREIARLSRGKYFRVAQSGSAVLFETPYDKKIAELSSELDATRIYYGNAAQRREMESRRAAADEIYAQAAPSAVAKRTIFNAGQAGRKNFLGSQELVQDVTSGAVALKDLAARDLPEAMQALNKSQLEQIIETRHRQRKDLQATIAQLARKRQQYIESKLREFEDLGDSSLDARIYRCIQAQAADRGIIYSGGPA